MATFVLVHGALHGAWCWVKLVPALEARGHRAVAFDLPSLGEDRTPIAEATLERWAARIADEVKRESVPVVLVGHSLAGVAIASAAERLPERIALLVYLTAFLPRDGDSVASISASQAAKRDQGPPTFVKSADGLSFSVVPDVAGPRFYAGCSEEDIAYALARVRPQAYSMLRTAVTLTPARYGSVKRAYVECLDDGILSLGLQRDMVAKSPCAEVVSLATGHSPFFSAPGELARHLMAP